MKARQMEPAVKKACRPDDCVRHIPFARVCLDGNELKYVRQVIESGWLTTAGRCLEFEQVFAEVVGARYALAINSCTAGLHLAVEAIGIRTGDAVFVPTMTFTASAEILRYLGAHPIFLDVDYDTCLVTAEILEEAIKRNPRARAVIPVHFGGQALDMDPVLEVCARHGVRAIEDAAHAFPTRYKNRMIGSLGDATSFSFYANKTITTGEGGIVTTEDDALYRRMKVMRLHGINRDVWDRFTAGDSNWEYDIVAPGFKYNLPDLAAAIGLAQLERAEVFRQERQRCAERYYKRLSDLDCLDLPVCKGPKEHHSWHLFWIVLNKRAKRGRNEVIRFLNQAGIGTSVHYKPLHRMTYYRDEYNLRPEDYPNAERHWAGTISLPVYPSLTNSDIDFVSDKLHEILA